MASRNQTLSALQLAMMVLVSVTSCAAGSRVFTACGGVLDEPRGIVQSPNFPARMPAPLACHWVIRAPPDKKIVVYFTQYFLRGALRLIEYDHYVSEYVQAGRNPLGEMNFEEDIRYVVAYRPYVVLELRLQNVTNLHLRVEDYLEDVYGFNITYEILNRTQHVRDVTCSVMSCSFLGHCLAAADFSRFQCACFPGFYGRECQYGPYCDPDKGINMCANSGRCRYIYGSTVNVCECPDGYTGLKCEEKKEHSLAKEECVGASCSDGCQDMDGGSRCACKDGVNHVTCAETELYRVSVTVVTDKQLHEWRHGSIHSIIHTFLQSTGLRTLDRLAEDVVNFTSEESILQFHFYLEKNEVRMISPVVGDLVYNLTGVAANHTITVHPETRLLSVESHNKVPAMEGKMMILVCTARGSPALYFRWYKDGQLFNASLTSRNAWELRLFDDINDNQVSVFNIDGVTTYDTGEFVCEIDDVDRKEEKKLRVHVLALPQVEVKPLTISLVTGQSHSFRCLSPDDNMRTFSYQWLRDGAMFEETVNGEVVEDLLPSGSRLFVSRARVSANYTCQVVNRAGATSKSVVLFVISPNQSDVACESSFSDGVRWNRTFGGYYDRQSCPVDPTDTAEFKTGGLGDAYARRDCVCQEDRCTWGDPNYARCQSVHIINIFLQLEQIQLGYQHGGLSDIYNSMYSVIQKAQNRTLAGDVELFARSLQTLLTVTLQFPTLAPEITSDFSLKTVAHFMDLLLKEMNDKNESEKKDLSVGARLIQVCEMMAELAQRSPSLVSLDNVTFPTLELMVRNVTLHPVNSSLAPSVPEVSLGTPAQTRSLRHVSSITIHTDYRDEADNRSTANKWRTRRVLQVTFSQTIIPVLPVRTRFSPHAEMFVTPVTSVIPVDLFEEDEDHTEENVKDLVQLEFVHAHERAVFNDNITRCVAWVPENRDRLVGHWSAKGCHVINRTANATVCLCPLHGHYAVTVVSLSLQLPVAPPAPLNSVLMVSCVISLCGLAACIAVYMITWRHIAGTTSIIHLSLVMSFAGVNLVCIFCLSETTQQMVCVVGKVLVQFLHLTSFSFLLAEAVHVFFKIRAVQGAAITHSTCIKYFLIGWGLPSVTTLMLILMSEVYGHDFTCHTWCWWSEGHWHFYAFLVPLVILSMVHTGVMVLCLVSTRTWKDETRFQNKKTYIFTAARAFSIETQLIVLCISGMLNESASVTESRRFLFLCVNCTLTATIIITMVFMRRRVRKALTLVCSKRTSEHTKTVASSSCRVSLTLEHESEETKVESIQQFYRETDRNKFTTEHKHYLRFLLGTSSSSSDSLSLETGSGGVSADAQLLSAAARFPQEGTRGGIRPRADSVRRTPSSRTAPDKLLPMPTHSTTAPDRLLPVHAHSMTAPDKLLAVPAHSTTAPDKLLPMPIPSTTAPDKLLPMPTHSTTAPDKLLAVPTHSTTAPDRLLPMPAHSTTAPDRLLLMPTHSTTAPDRLLLMPTHSTTAPDRLLPVSPRSRMSAGTHSSSHCLLQTPLCSDDIVERQSVEIVSSDKSPLEWKAMFCCDPDRNPHQVRECDFAGPPEGVLDAGAMISGNWQDRNRSGTSHGRVNSRRLAADEVTGERDALLTTQDNQKDNNL